MIYPIKKAAPEPIAPVQLFLVLRFQLLRFVIDELGFDFIQLFFV